MFHHLILAEGVTTGQVALALSTVGITSLVGITTVCVTHWLARAREVRQDKLKRLEQLFMSSREMLFDFGHVSVKARPAAEGHMPMSDVYKEIKAKADQAFGSGVKPYYHVEMLIEVYFRHMRPWLAKVNEMEILVRLRLQQQCDYQPGVAYNHGGTVGVLNSADRLYTAAAIEMIELVRIEAAKVDDWQWFTRPRLAPPAG